MDHSASRLAEMVDRRETLILSESQVKQVLDLRTCIEQQADAYRAFSAGDAIVPQRLRIPTPEAEGNSSFMPARVPELGVLACKVVSGFGRNRARGLPSTLGSMVLIDAQTGFPLAYLGSTYLTNARTGAGGAAAARALKRDGAATVGVLGSGALARTTLEALSLIMPIRGVTVYSRTEANRARYADEMRERLGLDVAAAERADGPSAADVVVVATTAEHPVLVAAALRPGATVVSVGTNRPFLAEFSAEAIRGNKFIGDSRASIHTEVGEFIMARDAGLVSEQDVYGEIGEVLDGRLPGRENEEEIIVFKSTGLAVQDVYTARGVYDAALEKGIGTRLRIQDVL